MLALLLAVATGLATAPAAADGGSCPANQACLLVTVTGTTQEQVVVTAEDLDAWGLDIQAPPYRTHSPGTTQDEPRPGAATSIPRILQHLATPVPVGSVTFVTTKPSADDPHSTRLGPGDLSAPGAPDTGFQGNTVPGFWIDPDRQLARFARPMRSDDDLNYQDVWTTSSDGTATLVIHTTGTIVHPQIHASTAKTVAGSKVGFTATFSDDQPPSSPTYSWTFGDGTTSTGAEPTHTWSRAGTYTVSLETGASDGSEGTATPVQVQVGAKPKPAPTAPVKTPGTGTGSKHHAATGPTTGTGTSNDATTAPETGSSLLGGSTILTPGTTTGGVTSSTPTTTLPSQALGAGTQTFPEGTEVSGVLLVSDATASSGTTVSEARRASAAAARAVPQLQWNRQLLWFLLLPLLLAAGGLTQTRWWSRWSARRLPALPWRTG